MVGAMDSNLSPLNTMWYCGTRVARKTPQRKPTEQLLDTNWDTCSRPSRSLGNLVGELPRFGWTGANEEANQEANAMPPRAVTSSKLEANRENAKRSTGPRTERGKSTARFNAVTVGLFAKHIVIPICDGYKPERRFKSLLEALH